MIRNIEELLLSLSEQTSINKRKIRQGELQRRNQVVDLYGVEYTRQGDSSTPATFFVSVSPDLVYYERFEFKLVISSFAMPIGGGGATGTGQAQIQGTVLNANSNSTSSGSVNLPAGTGGSVDPGTYPLTVNTNTNTSITPNPHDHTDSGHRHPLDAGVTLVPSTVQNVRVVIDGIDITQYLIDQYGGQWINGEGIYPNATTDNYDILTVAGKVPDWQKGVLLSPGVKTVQIFADGAFNVSLINYLKYSHVNR